MNVVITGASNGIGYQTALLLAQQGHIVFAVARNKNNLKKLKDENESLNPNSRLYTIDADLTQEDSIKKIKEEILSRTKSIHILINNAGLLINKSFQELTSKDWSDVYSTNVFAVTNLTRNILPLLSPFSTEDNVVVKPHILNISSIGGYQGSVKFSGLSAYSSSKAALVCITECLAEEFKEQNIAVNCLCLGSVQTEMFAAAFPKFKAGTTANEMAILIARFATEGQKLFNGKIIPVSTSTP